MEDGYPNVDFFLCVKQWMFLYEKAGIINYRKFCNARIRLKIAARKHSKRPEEFRGREDGFRFDEVARVRSFTKQELTSLHI